MKCDDARPSRLLRRANGPSEGAPPPAIAQTGPVIRGSRVRCLPRIATTLMLSPSAEDAHPAASARRCVA